MCKSPRVRNGRKGTHKDLDTARSSPKAKSNEINYNYSSVSLGDYGDCVCHLGRRYVPKSPRNGQYTNTLYAPLVFLCKKVYVIRVGCARLWKGMRSSFTFLIRTSGPWSAKNMELNEGLSLCDRGTDVQKATLLVMCVSFCGGTRLCLYICLRWADHVNNRCDGAARKHRF